MYIITVTRYESLRTDIFTSWFGKQVMRPTVCSSAFSIAGPGKFHSFHQSHTKLFLELVHFQAHHFAWCEISSLANIMIQLGVNHDNTNAQEFVSH